MAWLHLMIAAALEIGWPLGFKLASTQPENKLLWLTLAIASMGLSGLFLYWAQRTIPLGTAYVVWTGCGAVGTVLIGIYWFAEPATQMRILGILLVLAGALVLKLSE